ncbi:hypothetical protein [Sporosalibacterium faouarense]|uniref:hypothetical protein n=1 Tax=Sporosalibacterium faouarense TaxID=516123 RepID=UPI00141CE6BB|nr:hypothetical protein [Sporosalibacterium faouarense]MTI46664.1 hypothetical protein [Bacillota bacterium]
MSLSTEQLQNIVIDTGVVYVNYEETDEKMLGPCKGGNTFLVEQEFKEVEYDGRRGKTKGLRRIINENASLTVRLMDLSQENIKMALAGSNLDEATSAITNGDRTISDSDYLKNIALVGTTTGGKTKVITLFNALSDNGLNMEMVDKDELAVELHFSAHYDPANLESPIYKIEDVEVI